MDLLTHHGTSALQNYGAVGPKRHHTAGPDIYGTMALYSSSRHMLADQKQSMKEMANMVGTEAASHQKEKVNPAILGAAGEHYVMCQLLRRGMVAALAPAGVPDADIIVSNRLGSSLAAIQVKARSVGSAKGGWVMKAKHETIKRPLLFYAFVDFGKELDATAQCWVVPSAEVADAVRESHSAWLPMEGRGGQKHQDSDMRGFSHDYSKYGIGRPLGWLNPYREAWQLIEAASELPPQQDTAGQIAKLP